MEELKPFYGLFRGVIIENLDPESKGRVQVGIFLVGNGKRFDRWATLCVSNFDDYESITTRMPIGSKVWIEFENGDANKPVVLGLFR